MSDLCCKQLSIRINDPCLVDCESLDAIWVAGHTDINAPAYAPDLCYFLAMRRSADESETFFCRYNHSANTITDKASVVDYIRSNVVYDIGNSKFVAASATDVYVFNPGSETVSNPILTGATDCIDLLYVHAKNKIYGQFEVAGNWFIGEIDLLAGTCTMLGGITTFFANLTYSPIADALYGTTGGNQLMKFSLVSNTQAAAGAVSADDCGWDTDRELLVCFGSVITEVDTLTDIATVTNDHSWAYDTSKAPVYCSSLHKFYVVGYNSDTTQRIVYSYDTEDQRVQDVWHQTATESIGYYGVYPLDDATLFAAIYDIANPGTDGFRKLCATGLLEPYLYFKAENDASGVGETVSPAEERNGMQVLESNDGATGSIDTVAGIIGDGWQLNTNNLWYNQNLVGSLDPIWTNSIWNADFTIRLWVNVNVGTPDTAYILVGMTNCDLKYNLVGGAVLTFTWRWKPDGFPSYTAVAAAAIDSGWHRVIFWYKKGVEIGIKIDDDPSVTTAAPVLRALEFPNVSIRSSVENPAVDEFAIYKGLVLTEDEMTTDWNNGDGTTWPEPTPP